MGPAGTTSRSSRSLSEYLAKLPLFISFSILGVTWIGFFLTISIPEVLLRRREVWHFVEQFIVFNGLVGLTILSLLVASTRSPGHPDPSLAPFPYEPDPNDEGALLYNEGRALPAVRLPSARLDRVRTNTAFPASQTVYRTDHQGHDEHHEDDIPLRSLQKRQPRLHRTPGDSDRPAPLSLTSYPGQRDGVRVVDDGDLPEISPFPLNLSPFVPTTTTDAGDDSDLSDEDEEGQEEMSTFLRKSWRGEAGPSRSQSRRRRPHPNIKSPEHLKDSSFSQGGEIDEALLNEVEAEIALIAEEQESQPGSLSRFGDEDEARGGGWRRSGRVLMAKSDTGKPRFCSKCKAWKPDRCHHCRLCKKCVLKSEYRLQYAWWIGRSERLEIGEVGQERKDDWGDGTGRRIN